MLTRNQISEITTKAQTSEENIAREYCQHLFLSSLSQVAGREKLFFKGGTALRIIFNSPRFSEDLDFGIADSDQTAIENILTETLGKVYQTGMKIELEEAKITTGGYLSRLIFSWETFNLPVQIEISGRKKNLKGNLVIAQSEYMPTYSIMLLQTKDLVAEKIQAALSRGKPRDFFDIYFMLRSRMIEPEQKKILKEIPKKLAEKNIDLSKELKEFLPISMHLIIREFPQALEREIKRNV